MGIRISAFFVAAGALIELARAIDGTSAFALTNPGVILMIVGVVSLIIASVRLRQHSAQAAAALPRARRHPGSTNRGG